MIILPDNFNQLTLKDKLVQLKRLNDIRTFHAYVRSNKILMDDINAHTPLLQNWKYNVQTKIYWIIKDITEFPKCKTCDNIIGIKKNIGVDIKHYTQYCSKKCANSNTESLEKRRINNIKKFGGPSPSSDVQIRRKQEETCLIRYGVKNPSQSQEIKDKKVRTCKYHYGVDNPNQSKDIIAKRIKTNIYKYGCEHGFQNEDIKNKIKQTNIEKYGVENYTQTKECQEKIKYTCLQKYGETSPMKSLSVQQKMRITCMKKYGVEWPTLLPQNRQNRRKRIEYDNHFFDSSWEVIVYKYCKSKQIDFEYQTSLTYKYEYNGITHTYFPDFLINGKVYEIKGDQFFRVNENGQEELFNPFRLPKWSDVEYEEECNKQREKYKCMLNNNVTIIRKKDLNDLDNIIV